MRNIYDEDDNCSEETWALAQEMTVMFGGEILVLGLDPNDSSGAGNDRYED